MGFRRWCIHDNTSSKICDDRSVISKCNHELTFLFSCFPSRCPIHFIQWNLTRVFIAKLLQLAIVKYTFCVVQKKYLFLSDCGKYCSTLRFGAPRHSFDTWLTVCFQFIRPKRSNEKTCKYWIVPIQKHENTLPHWTLLVLMIVFWDLLLTPRNFSILPEMWAILR